MTAGHVVDEPGHVDAAARGQRHDHALVGGANGGDELVLARRELERSVVAFALGHRLEPGGDHHHVGARGQLLRRRIDEGVGAAHAQADARVVIAVQVLEADGVGASRLERAAYCKIDRLRPRARSRTSLPST